MSSQKFNLVDMNQRQHLKYEDLNISQARKNINRQSSSGIRRSKEQEP